MTTNYASELLYDCTDIDYTQAPCVSRVYELTMDGCAVSSNSTLPHLAIAPWHRPTSPEILVALIFGDDELVDILLCPVDVDHQMRFAVALGGGHET